MSTLNIAETESLQDARGRISSVRARLRKASDNPLGMHFEKKDLESMIAALDFADRQVNTIVAMKGYYPK